jgi:DnaJ-class molecular chaperone
VTNDPRRRLDDDPAIPSDLPDQPFDRRWCADEVAIDFPAIPPAIDRIRSAFVDEEARAPLRAELRLSVREAFDGVTVPLDVPVRSACPLCGGRGESWMEWCRGCGGTGESLFHHRVRLALPAGVSDGARFRFRVTSPLALPTRVEVLVAIG